MTYNKEEYERNKAAYKRRMDKYITKKRAEDLESWKAAKREATRKYRRTKRLEMKIECQKLLGGKCARCGEDDPLVLDFDHLDSSQKTMNISQAISKKVTPQVMEEIKKCQLLCANCHRRVTWERGEFNSYRKSSRRFRNPNRTKTW